MTFHGHVSEHRKHELLSRAWVHVMPSRKEGWGLAVIEAAQHGVPTVGYRSSRGLTDSIVDGVTGLVVGADVVDPAGNADDVAALTGAVEDLLLDAEHRAELGEKARARAREFSWAQTGAGVHRVLAESAAGRHVSGLIGTAAVVAPDAEYAAESAAR